MADPEAETVVGFAPLPHRLCRLPLGELSLAAYRLLGALMYFFRARPTCEPTNAEIVEATGGLSLEAINQGLRQLERLGVIAVDRPTARSRGAIRLLLHPDLGGAPEGRRPIPLNGKGHPSKLDAHPTELEAHPTQLDTPHTPLYGMENLRNNTQGGGLDAHPAQEEVPDGWGPGDLDRLHALADHLFPMLDFGLEVGRHAHLFPPAYFEAALNAAAYSGKTVNFPYILGICRRYLAQGGPPPESRAGAGVKPRPSQTRPIQYVEANPRKSYGPPPGRPKGPGSTLPPGRA